MYRKIYNIGKATVVIGLILLFFGFLFGERFFLFDFGILWQYSKSVSIFGLFLFILGVVFTIMGIFLSEELKIPEPQIEEKELYSGVCPVCHQEFKTNAEIKNGYYIFNCNRCNSRLRVKKSTFYPAG